MGWFNAGRWVQPALSAGYWHSWQETNPYENLARRRVSGKMFLLDGWFVYGQSEVDRLSQFGLQKIREDPSWFKDFFKECHAASKALENASKNLSGLDVLAAWNYLSKPMRNVHALWTFASNLFDISLNKAFSDFSKKSGVKETELAALVKPVRPTRLVLQQREARELKRKILDFTSKYDVFDATLLKKIRKDAPLLYDDIQRHLSRFAYVGIHHFWGEPLSFEKILDIELRVEKQVENKTFENYRELIQIASEMAFWRQYIAETTGVAAYNAMGFFKESAQAVGISPENYMHLADFEYVSALKESKKFSLDLIRERKVASGMISDGCTAKIVSGSFLQEKINDVVILGQTNSPKELRGTVACIGNAKGIARIVLVPQDILKINEGDVMVAPETAPDFVAGLRKVSALVTDQGGVTSHAAIVSRELNIPCIVGTKFATRILKDGDFIEVDAVNGIVRLIR